MPVVKRHQVQWVDQETGDRIAEQFTNGKIYVNGGSFDSAGLTRLFEALPVLIEHAKDWEEVAAKQQAIMDAQILKETGI